MISRRKKIILVQVSIFLIATSLLYSTYRDKNKETQEVVEIKSETDPNINVFNDINKGILQYMKQKNYSTVNEMVGLAKKF